MSRALLSFRLVLGLSGGILILAVILVIGWRVHQFVEFDQRKSETGSDPIPGSHLLLRDEDKAFDSRIEVREMVSIPVGAFRLGSLRLRHGDDVTVVGFCEGNNQLLSASEDGIVRLWSTETGEFVRTLPVTRRGGNVALSSNGEMLLYPDSMGCITCLDVKGNSVPRQLAVNGNGTYLLAISHDGKLAACVQMDNTVIMMSTVTGLEVTRFPIGCPEMYTISHFGFSPNGDYITASWFRPKTVDSFVRILNPSTGRLVREVNYQLDRVYGALVFGSGNLLAVGTTGGRVYVYEVGSGSLVAKLAGPKTLQGSLAASMNGRFLASGGNGQIRLWDLENGNAQSQLAGHTDSVLTLAFSPDSTMLASSGRDRTVRLWLTHNGKERFPSQQHQNAVDSVCFLPDGSRIASAGRDGTLCLWDSKTKRRIVQFDGAGRPLTSLTCSVDGKACVAAEPTGLIHHWTMPEGRETRLECPEDEYVTNCLVSPNGLRVYSINSDRSPTISVWDTVTRQVTHNLTAESVFPPLSLSLSSDGRYLSSSHADSITLWDTSDKHAIREFPVRDGPCFFTAFSDDGGQLASIGSSGCVRIWQTSTGIALRTFSPATSQPASFSFSPDGAMVALGMFEGQILVFEVATGAQRRVLHGHLGRVGAVQFSPDGRYLASGGDDTTIIVWDLFDSSWEGLLQHRLSVSEAWEALSGTDAVNAFQATTLFVSNSDYLAALSSLVDKENEPLETEMNKLVQDLSSDDFSTRVAARRKLGEFGAVAAPSLRTQLKKVRDLEATKSIENALEQIDNGILTSSELRLLRVVEALEKAKSEIATRILRTLSQGTPHARSTQASVSALRRVEAAQARASDKEHAH